MNEERRGFLTRAPGRLSSLIPAGPEIVHTRVFTTCEANRSMPSEARANPRKRFSFLTFPPMRGIAIAPTGVLSVGSSEVRAARACWKSELLTSTLTWKQPNAGYLSQHETSMAHPAFLAVDPAALALPECPLPRPGERVCWYADSRLVTGVYKGHNREGQPLILNDFDNPVLKESFDAIRLHDPFTRLGPNWSSLPPSGNIVRPPQSMREAFRALLRNRIPPGPTYLDLATEIWSRGFEVFVVGGTVRDVLHDANSRDVDFVTTMPLVYARRFLRSMYRYDPSEKDSRGFIRIGGSPDSGDPFIDLKVFSDSLLGTEDATFGVGFERDVKHREFACNCLYYDPINEVLVDPTGYGIEDAIVRRLRLVCGTDDPHQHAQLFLRYFKFLSRGYSSTEETTSRVCGDFSRAVPAMKTSVRLVYFRAQILNKCESRDEHPQAIAAIRRLMTDCGLQEIWNKYFEPLAEDCFSDC
jgi:hypothetical protein